MPTIPAAACSESMAPASRLWILQDVRTRAARAEAVPQPRIRPMKKEGVSSSCSGQQAQRRLLRDLLLAPSTRDSTGRRP